MSKFVQKVKPFLRNCASYGTLFIGAEFTQQLYLRKYQPYTQVEIREITWSSIQASLFRVCPPRS